MLGDECASFFFVSSSFDFLKVKKNQHRNLLSDPFSLRLCLVDQNKDQILVILKQT